MSKIVIVFSTYYNSPVAEDYLFSKETATPCRFSSKQLCDYFWKRFTNDYLKGIAEDTSQYLSEKALTDLNERIKQIKDDRKTELEKYLTDNQDALVEFLETNADTIKGENNGQSLVFSTEDLNWVAMLSMLINYKKIQADSDGVISSLMDKYNEYNKNVTDTYVDVLRNHYDGVWLKDNLIDKGNQEPLDIYVPLKIGYKEQQPWLLHRFSYYKFNEETGEPNDVSVYAVWPLLDPSPDESDDKKAWVEALTDQFFMLEQDADELYLILHDKDIKPTPFEIFSDCVVQNKYDNNHDVQRCVVLFQHSNFVGSFLGQRVKVDVVNKNKSLSDIKTFVAEKVMDINVYVKRIADVIALDETVDSATDITSVKDIENDEDTLNKINELSKSLRKALLSTMNME